MVQKTKLGLAHINQRSFKIQNSALRVGISLFDLPLPSFVLLDHKPSLSVSSQRQVAELFNQIEYHRYPNKKKAAQRPPFLLI